MLLHFRIQLAPITRPPVWRRVTVPDSFTFHRFHEVIQAAFGWDDSHLYQFSANGYGSDSFISIPDPDDFPSFKEQLDARKTKLSAVFKEAGMKYTYLYDFGDDWLHHITLEKITDDAAKFADCTAGKGACPPEDCGGPWGYEGLKEALKDPANPERGGLLEWMGVMPGESWDPQAFSLADAQEAVRRV